MGVYRYDSSQVESIIGAMKRSRLRHCATASAVLVAASVCGLVRPTWIFGASQHARAWVVLAMFVLFVGPLVESLVRWKSRPRRLEESLRATRVEVSGEGITMASLGPARHLARHEICRVEEIGWGLYVRSRRRYRWIFIPSGVADFEDLKRELVRMGIAIVPATIPPNWEEVIGGILFVGTVCCAIYAQSVGLLAVNLGISVLVGVAGFVVLSANPDNLPKMRWARFAVFLPVAMTASMLWAAMHG